MKLIIPDKKCEKKFLSMFKEMINIWYSLAVGCL